MKIEEGTTSSKNKIAIIASQFQTLIANPTTNKKIRKIDLKQPHEINALIRHIESNLKLNLEASDFNQLKQKIRNLSNEYKAKHDRDLHVITPHFSQEKIAHLENEYPETLRSLFEAALCIVDGSFGSIIKDWFYKENNPPILFEQMVALLILYKEKAVLDRPLVWKEEIFCKPEQDKSLNVLAEQLKEFNNEENKLLREVVDRIELDKDEKTAFEKIFDNYLLNLKNPHYFSQELINHLMNHLNLMERAIDFAVLLKNPNDQSKGLELLIHKFLNLKDFDAALKLWELIPIPKIKYQVANKIAETCIQSGLAFEVLQTAQDMQSSEEKDKLLRDVAFEMTKKKQLKKAIVAVKGIKDSGIKAYTLSVMSHLLCSQLDFSNAKKIALKISDLEYKEDAIVDIVRSLVVQRQIEPALKFINSLPDSIERRKPFSFIERALKIYHENDKVT